MHTGVRYSLHPPLHEMFINEAHSWVMIVWWGEPVHESELWWDEMRCDVMYCTARKRRQYFNDAHFISPRASVAKVAIPRCTLQRQERLHNSPQNVHLSRKRVSTCALYLHIYDFVGGGQRQSCVVRCAGSAVVVVAVSPPTVLSRLFFSFLKMATVHRLEFFKTRNFNSL